MKLDKINEFKDAFMMHLSNLANKQLSYEEGFKWDIIQNWQEEFEISNLDIGPSLNMSLRNSFSGRLWGGEKYSIKSEMLNLIKQNPLFMQATFQNLFNEEHDISMRINRFEHHCDIILSELNAKDDRYNNHRQNDYSASLFLSFEYPEKYGLFEYDKFYKFMELSESRNIPVLQDKERYFKILNAIYIVISKDIDFMNGVSFLLKGRKYNGKSLFLVNDLIDFTLSSQV